MSAWIKIGGLTSRVCSIGRRGLVLPSWDDVHCIGSAALGLKALISGTAGGGIILALALARAVAGPVEPLAIAGFSESSRPKVLLVEMNVAVEEDEEDSGTDLNDCRGTG